MAERKRILGLLRQRGPAGVTNLELFDLCSEYQARIYELRRQGFAFSTIREGERVYRFVLLGGPEKGKPVHRIRRGRAADRSQLHLFAEAGHG